MIAAARSLFLERGYDAVTLNEIVRRSGGSLSTLYDLFENKAGLLGAIVAEERFEGIERMDAIVARGDGAAETLGALARLIRDDFAQPEVVGMMRIVMAETLRDAAFARLIYQHAHLPRVAWLTDLFARWAARGQARIANPMHAAQFFLGLSIHAAQTQAFFCADIDAIDWDGFLADAVTLFIDGYAITAAAPEAVA